MIEYIKEQIVMPISDDRRYQKDCKNFGSRSEKWFVIDTMTNTVRYQGKFEDVALACHNLNKKYYRDEKYK